MTLPDMPPCERRAIRHARIAVGCFVLAVWLVGLAVICGDACSVWSREVL